MPRIIPLVSGWVTWLGAGWDASLPGRAVQLFLKVLVCPFRGRKATLHQISEIFVQQTYFTAVEAIPLIVGLAVLIGGVTLVEFATVLPRVGNSDFLGDVMVLVVLRELAPLFTAFIVAGRTGSALATFIGNMKVHNEIDALESMGIDPVRFLVLPAVLGCTVGMICLSLLFTASAILGGFVVAHILALLFPGSLGLEMELPLYLLKVASALRAMDGVIMILKPAIFGLSIALLACMNGLSLGISNHEVPQGTRSAVVQSFVSVVVIDGIFAAIFVIPQMLGMVP